MKVITALCALAFALIPSLYATNLSADKGDYPLLSESTEESVNADCAGFFPETRHTAEDVTAISDDGARNENKNDFIKWVDFKVPYEVLKADYELYRAARAEGTSDFDFIDALAYLACKNGNSFETKSDKKRLEKLASRLSEEHITVSEALGENKYFGYYRECYKAIFGGNFGERADGTNGLTAYFPLAKGYWFSHYDDFGNARSYGFKRRHLGHDIMGSVGTPVVAVEGGEVVECGWNRYGGWRVGIRSADKKRYYYYAHLRKDKPFFEGIEKGVTVVAGQPIGYLGVTGYSTKENVNMKTKPHLHLGLQLIFDESQVDGNGEIWIDLYSLTRFWLACGQRAEVGNN